MDGQYYYASSSFINWLKEDILANGSGSVYDDEYRYTAYGYEVEWASNMMMNQLYLCVDDEYHIIMVNNTFYKIPSSDKVGIP